MSFRFDVLVIGSGIAGLSYVLSLAQLKPHVRIALLCKKTLTESNSSYAQGGIAAVGLLEDSIQQHSLDTLSAGDGLCDAQIVEKIIGDGPSTIEFLNQWGMEFDQARNFSLAQEGGHSQRRIYTHGDRVGAAIIRVLDSSNQTFTANSNI